MKSKLNSKVTLLLIGALFISSQAKSQHENEKPNVSPPIPVELMFGNNRFVSQISINKRFAENSRFGFLASTYIAADYSNDKNENESMNVALINFEILKGFALVSGAALNSYFGFRPYSGFLFHYANPQLSAVLIPGFYLTESQNFETTGLIEYHPYLKNDWSLYSRVEGAYNRDMDTKKHDRSFIYTRLGLSYKSFGFGMAANYDWYGPFKADKENFGIFIRTEFK